MIYGSGRASIQAEPKCHKTLSHGIRMGRLRVAETNVQTARYTSAPSEASVKFPVESLHAPTNSQAKKKKTNIWSQIDE